MIKHRVGNRVSETLASGALVRDRVSWAETGRTWTGTSKDGRRARARLLDVVQAAKRTGNHSDLPSSSK